MAFDTTRRATLGALGAIIGGGALSGSATASRPRQFTAHQDTDAHPEPDTNAVGQAIFQLRDDDLRFKLIVANIEDVLMAHIHLESVVGPVSVWLHDFETTSPSLLEGRVNGVIARDTITDDEVGGPIDTVEDLIDEMDDGNAFVNVHTVAFPGGEIGGQIHPRG